MKDHQGFYANKGFNENRDALNRQRQALDARAWQMRQDAAMASSQPRIPPISNVSSPDSYQAVGPGSDYSRQSRSSGIGIGSVIAVALVILCLYAVTHGVSVVAVGKVAIMGAVALAAIAILIGVLTFIRNHFFGIAVIVGVAIYVWVHAGNRIGP